MNRMKECWLWLVTRPPNDPKGWTIAAGLAFIAAALLICALLCRHPHI
jgi:hypothetical protein